MPLIIAREIAALSGRPMQAMGAATALKHAAMQRANADAIVAGGAIVLLVELLKPGVKAELQDEAAAVLRALCVGSGSTRTAICTAGAVPYLVSLLGSDHEETQEQAAGLLASLAMDPGCAEAIADSAAVVPLLRICSIGSGGARLDAASAVRNLSAHPAAHAQVVEGGAVDVLESLSRDGPPKVAGLAQSALTSLAAATPPHPPATAASPSHGQDAEIGSPSTSLEPVPRFLQGVWMRDSIRRAVDEHGTLGAPCTAPAVYVQTPHAFVDVRQWHGEASDLCTCGGRCRMAFAGVATSESTLPPGAGSWAFGGARRVSWHACHDWAEPVEDFESCWSEALDGGHPRPTEDVGDFAPVDAWSGNVWRERDPDGSLEEQWRRVDDGGGDYFAARRGAALLCVAGGWFGYVEDGGERGAAAGATSSVYAVGRLRLADDDTTWRVESCSEKGWEGTRLVLPGAVEEWRRLPGCTLDWPVEVEAGEERGQGMGLPVVAFGRANVY